MPYSGETGLCCGEESYCMKGCQVPPKAAAVNISAPIVQAPQEVEVIVPRSKTPMSTNNNKGGSIQHPPKPTINLVSRKDVAEGDATIRWDSKDYH